MYKLNTENLTGKCLISSPYLDDEHFMRSVIYICSHTKDGAMGFVINKKLQEFSFADLTVQLPISNINPNQEIYLHQGGPLEKIRGFVIHSTDYVKSDTIIIDKQIAISSSLDIITDIAFGIGPKDNIIALGYSSWSAKQLEQEIINNNWFIADPEPELVFRTKDEDKWQKALQHVGIEIDQLSSFSGRA